VEQGKDAVYNGVTPTRDADAQYTYTFVGWDQSLTNIQASGDRIAQYSNSTNQYTITFVNYDGSELDKSVWDYGSTPSYSGTPTRPADAQYSYVFSGWSPTLAPVTNNATYTAQYSSSVNQYTVIFANWDGSELQNSLWDYGATPSYSGTPTKAGDAQYSYTFSGWSPAITAVTGNATYTAQYSSSLNQYTISFLNYDGSELEKSLWDYGATPSYSGTPVKPATVASSYVFSGWSPAIVAVTENASYTAQYSASTNQYTITFLNYDDTELQKSLWDYGATPSYSGTPTKAGDAQYSYVFSGWSPLIVPVTGDATYKAQYSSSTNQYTITFVNYDGTELQKSAWDYGSTPLYSGATPTKAADASYTYTFSGWEPEIAQVTASATYTAVFLKEAKGTEGLTYKLASDGKSYSVSQYSGTATDVIVPAKYNGIPVTSIGERAFYNCTGLSSIAIPNSVTSIGQRAFSYCAGLTSVTIGNSVASIGDYAFCNCTGLTSVTIPDSVKSIGDYAFQNCAGLTSVAIPSSVTSIGGKAFSYCTGLTSVTIGNSVASIGGYAFKGCAALTSVTIPASVTSIGDYAFFGCAGLASIIVDSANLNYQSIDGVLYSKDGETLIAYPAGKSGSAYAIPDSVTSIGYDAFSGCTGLTSIAIPDSVTSIGYDAFSGCTGLTSIAIPDSVTSIGEAAFYRCTALSSIVIPDSVTSIGVYAFFGCTGLTSVTIPNSVMRIGVCAFKDCTGCAIYCEATSKPSNWSDFWNYRGGIAYWYCETERTGCWRYVNGVPTPWW
jgi:hypothetical protein